MIISPYDWKCLNQYQQEAGRRTYQCRNCGSTFDVQSGVELGEQASLHYEDNPECKAKATFIEAGFPYKAVVYQGRSRPCLDPPDLLEVRPDDAARRFPWEKSE